MKNITPSKYLNKEGWFCYSSKDKPSKAFKISIPFEKLQDDVKKIYIDKFGEIVFNNYSLFL